MQNAIWTSFFSANKPILVAGAKTRELARIAIPLTVEVRTKPIAVLEMRLEMRKERDFCQSRNRDIRHHASIHSHNGIQVGTRGIH